MGVIIKKATKDNLEAMIQSRYETMKKVSNLNDDYEFCDDFKNYTKEYFLKGNQTTVLAIDDTNMKVVGNASICYIDLLPTFSHPNGKRSHLMNVYVQKNFRHQKIASKMVSFLIEEAKAKGVTEISLDATDDGRHLYETLGFIKNEAGMILHLKK